ncbi:MAG: tryptophan--tRNA ligase [Candidatus Absconditabacteria bacterium]|nr:tryptophan--tRNA ligase [Candidatus Absconditabacteria bacterium]MDD3868516.1 tryptophan--tRNA ligase [Candidatus Absconditabacteria bacterium]MDD4713888.1 tryptophan--tRNA ligase [Candidatus Absconditabacteria bacterium]
MTKRILTGLKPTGEQLHIGNYFGAIKPFIDLTHTEKDAEFFLFLANMHGFTQLHDPKTLKEYSLTILKLYLAIGINPNKVFIYNPAEIPAHAQLNRVLSCLTIMGTMERMHSYKDALAKGKAGELSVGTFNYPVLMAADILLYDADLVPVGQDQKQHVEYARDIAEKFNRQYGETFKVPHPLINREVATITGLDGRKMSKSYNNYIGLLDDEKTLLKKVKQIATDTKTVEESKNPDECNVYKIGKLFLTPEEDQARRKKYLAGGLSYKEAKEYTFEKMRNYLAPIQKKYHAISDEEVIHMLAKNTSHIQEIAQKKITEVYKKIGFTLS